MLIGLSLSFEVFDFFYKWGWPQLKIERLLDNYLHYDAKECTR